MNRFKFWLERNRLRILPRYKKLTSSLLGFTVIAPDKSSFVYMYDEIFNKEIYKFSSSSNKPLIIDCGANIGLSVMYFKSILPESRIIAFEPDKKIFDYLKTNVVNSGFQGIDLINKGLAKTDGRVAFFSEGADGGRIAVNMDNDSIVEVDVTRLSGYIKDNEVDFLKIDIEGTEVEVLKECEPYICNIKNLFIEYHSLSHRMQELGDLLKILTNNGFRYYIDRVGVSSRHPFIKIETHSGYDLQLNISATQK